MEKERMKSMESAGIMSWEEYAETEHETPYVFNLEKGDKLLIYFGAGHSNDPENPMFEEIEEEFNELEPDIVFIEGWEGVREQIDRENEAVRRAREASRDEIIERYGESGFTLKLALEKGVEVDTLEPTFEAQVEHLLKEGYEKEEVFAYYLYRVVAQYYRRQPEQNLEHYLEPHIDGFRKKAQWEDFDYSIEHLQEIGKRIWGDAGNINDDKHARKWANPVLSAEKYDGTVVNDVAAATSDFRDRYMVGRIREALRENDRVFAVCGASHVVMQEEALRSSF